MNTRSSRQLADSRPGPSDPAESGLLWLKAKGWSCRGASPMAGDVSSRSYYRVVLEGHRLESAILAHYPADLRRSYACFERSDELLQRIGVDTPRILERDADRRFMLTEDVGSDQLFTVEGTTRQKICVYRAVELARRIAGLAADQVAGLSPALEVELLTREMRKTFSGFFAESIDSAARQTLESCLFGLCETLGAGPLQPAHRDFMARNLMVGRGDARSCERLVVLDHQDLRLAPSGYDLASLFYDSCPLSAEVTSRILDETLTSEAQRLAVARCAVQRCVKIVGTFASFAARGSDRYLAMVPGALETAARQLARLPEADRNAIEVLETCARDARERFGERFVQPG